MVNNTNSFIIYWDNFNTFRNFIIGTCCPKENILIDKLDASVPSINNNCYICSNNSITLNYDLVNNYAKELFDLYFNDINAVKEDFNATNITFITLSGHCAELITHCLCDVVFLPKLVDKSIEKYPMLIDCNTYYKYDVTSHIFPIDNINLLKKFA